MKVLVLGATGMLGHVAMEVFGERFDAHGTARDVERARALGVEGPLHRLEAGDGERLAALLDEVRPEAVVNCVGLVKQLREANRPAAAIELNSLFPQQVAEACAARQARFVELSTDCVFSGRLDPPAAYSEEHTPDPDDLYGRSKLLGEVAGDGALTIRTSMIGWELERQSGLLEWFAAQPGPAVDGFVNAIFSGTTTRVLAGLIADLLAGYPGLSGVYHVSAAPISKYALLEKLRDALGLTRVIVPVHEPRINRALDPTRFRAATGLDVPSWDTMLDDLANEKA